MACFKTEEYANVLISAMPNFLLCIFCRDLPRVSFHFFALENVRLESG